MSQPAAKTITTDSSLNDVRCPSCGAAPGEGCMTPAGNPANAPHVRRVRAFWEAVRQVEKESVKPNYKTTFPTPKFKVEEDEDMYGVGYAVLSHGFGASRSIVTLSDKVAADLLCATMQAAVANDPRYI